MMQQEIDHALPHNTQEVQLQRPEKRVQWRPDWVREFAFSPDLCIRHVEVLL